MFFLIRSPGDRAGEVEALIAPAATAREREVAAFVSWIAMPQFVVMTLLRRTVPHPLYGGGDSGGGEISIGAALGTFFRCLALDFSSFGLVPGLAVFGLLWGAFFAQQAMQSRVMGKCSRSSDTLEHECQQAGGHSG